MSWLARIAGIGRSQLMINGELRGPSGLLECDMLRDAYLDAARSAADLLADPAVAAHWTEPSALPEFRVSGLAGHLARQITMVPVLLDAPPGDRPPIGLLDHYSRVAWVGAALDDEVNVGIREQGEQFARSGPEAVVAEVRATIALLAERLPAETNERAVDLSWTGWSLTLDDFLVTRTMEIGVHSDDLAVSVGLPTPELRPDARSAVLTLLTDLAVRRHGATAVLRALSRAERAPETIAAF